MNILVVSSFLPYPLFSGGHIRLYQIIKRLSKNHSLTLVCEKRNYQTDDDVHELEKYCKEVIVVRRKKQWSLLTVGKTLFSLKPFLITGHTHEEMTRKIQEVMNKIKLDVIHAETFYIMQNIPKTTVPVVLVEHNIEYLVYERFLQTVPFFLRPLLYLDILKLKKVEKYFWKKATKLVAVSEEERDLMKREDVVVVPNGVDLQEFRIQNLEFRIGGEKRVLFIGDFKWVQNRDALKWILREIYPSFVKLFNGKTKLKLWVVGKNIPDSLRNMTNDTNVVFDENAPADTEKIYQRADVLLAPIRVGGGTSFKILEAMATGVPVIATSLGIEGIKARESKDFLLANTTDEFVRAIDSLLTNKKSYESLRMNARKLIEENYNWDHIVKILDGVYQEAVKIS